MLDAIVYIDICKIEDPSAVRAVQDLRDVTRRNQTKRWRKVVGRPDSPRKFLEGNIAAITLDDSLQAKHMN